MIIQILEQKLFIHKHIQRERGEERRGNERRGKT
jgi:hypothetical protein